MRTFLDFEKPIAELEAKIEELRHISADTEVNIAEEVSRLKVKAEKILRQTYGKLTPWQKVQVARHAERPHFTDFAAALVSDFQLLSGDRLYAEDSAILGGIGRFHGRSVLLMGHEKGADTESRVQHNFGMPRPEGYRKAQRLMRLADRFGLPVISLVDTAGAYPGIGAEERGQAEAIAKSIECCLSLQVPVISIIIGEGGSGGAIAIAAANQVMMLEHAVYSVISPEGCASILWRSGEHAREAATAMQLTSESLLSLGVIDRIIAEPLGGAHRDREAVYAEVDKALAASLGELLKMDGGALRRLRREKFIEMGREIVS